MTEPLKLYVNKALRAPHMSHIPLLYPFWGPIEKDTVLYMVNAMKDHGYDPSYFSLVESIHEADYVLIPHDYWVLKKKRPDLLEAMIAEAEKAEKPILIDASSDQFGTISVSNARILRINQYRFELPSYEITVPVACEDLLEVFSENKLTIREKSDLPTIGFVGWADMALLQRIRSLTKELPVRLQSILDPRQAAKIKGVFWRERANKIFERSKKVKTNFIIRTSYSGHTKTVVGDVKQNRLEFVRNIIDSDYALVIKGDANAATRFYEALSLGRIPVVIDTACVFPLEDILNYRDFCVFIDHRDLVRAPDILADFHASLSGEEFKAMQQRARDAFAHYLRYDSYSKYLVEILKKDVPFLLV